MLTVDCVFPYRNVPEVELDIGTADDVAVAVLDQTPEMAFMDAQDVEILLSVSPIYNLTSIACQFHDV